VTHRICDHAGRLRSTRQSRISQPGRAHVTLTGQVGAQFGWISLPEALLTGGCRGPVGRRTSCRPAIPLSDGRVAVRLEPRHQILAITHGVGGICRETRRTVDC